MKRKMEAKKAAIKKLAMNRKGSKRTEPTKGKTPVSAKSAKKVVAKKVVAKTAASLIATLNKAKASKTVGEVLLNGKPIDNGQGGQTAKFKGKTITAKSAKTSGGLIDTLKKGKAKAAVVKEEKKAAKIAAKKQAEIEMVWEWEGEHKCFAVFSDLLLHNMATITGYIAFDPTIVIGENGALIGRKMKKDIDLRKYKMVQGDEETGSYLEGKIKHEKKTVTVQVLL